MAISNRSQMHVLYLFNVFLSVAFNDDAFEQNHHNFVAFPLCQGSIEISILREGFEGKAKEKRN